MKQIKQWTRAIVSPAIILAAAILVAGLFPSDTLGTPGRVKKGGFIAAKGIVKGPSGFPIWVKFGEQGDFGPYEIIGEATGELENAIVMSADTYHAAVQAEGLPDTIAGTTKAVLVDEPTLTVLEESEYNIGYLAAFYSPSDTTLDNLPAGGSSAIQGMWGFDRTSDQLWGPIPGAAIELGGWRTYSEEDGSYVIEIAQPQDCYPVSYIWTLLASLRFTTFNPRSNDAGVYYVGKDVVVNAEVNPYLCPQSTVSTSLSSTDTSVYDTNDSLAGISLVNFAVDVTMLAGKGVIVNETHDSDILLDPLAASIVPVVDTDSLYACTQPVPEITDPPTPMDLDYDGTPDYMALDGNGNINVWLGNLDPANDPPTFTRRADYNPDLVDRGLLKQINNTDLLNTDIYVFRVSNGQKIAERIGLRPEESNMYYGGGTSDDSESPVNYRMLIRGPASFDYKNRAENFEKWQAAVGVDDELIGVFKDHLRVGEQVKVIMINRATGYIGTSTATVGENNLLNILPEKIKMRPPNLKIRAERTYVIEGGATDGETMDYLIGFEGSGLTSDTVIAITTEWVDWDGSPLPENLPGYTARLARVIESDTPDQSILQGEEVETQNGNKIANFPIKSGLNTQMVRLPQEIADRAHFYIHVSGETTSGAPDFSSKADFQTLGGEDVDPMLEFRPKHFVPVKVPVFDDETTWENQIEVNQAVSACPVLNPGDVENVYAWVYRPEMQFSLFDYNVSELTMEDSQGEIIDLLENIVAPDELAGSINLLYTLLEETLPMLQQFGPDRELIFNIGGQEYEAVIGADNQLEFVNLNTVKTLKAEDYLAIRLYQNGDDVNVLWEYAFIDIDIYLGSKNNLKFSIPIGGREKAIAETKPDNIEVTWSINQEESDKGVHAEIDQESGWIEVDKESEEGILVIRATDRDNPKTYKEALVHIGCECRSCEQALAYVNARISSIDADIGLGAGIDDGSAGKLYLRADTPSPELSTPKALIFSTLSLGIESLRDEDGNIRQILAPKTLVDIVVNNDFSYDVNFYPPDAAGGIVNGFYEIDSSAVPKAIWRVENPDASADTYNRLKLTEIKGTETKVNEYIWDDALNQWTLSRGNGAQIETSTEVISGDDRIKTHTIKNASGDIASVTQTTFHTFPWGEEITQEIVDPSGEALTTTKTYYEDPADTGNYKRVETRTNPDGSWIRYNYDTKGRVITETRSWLDAPSTSTPASARVTTYDYDPVDINDTEDPRYVNSPRTITEMIEANIVSRAYYAYTGNDIDGRTEITEVCSDTSASYGSSGNQRTVRNYYPKDDSSADSELIQSVTYPDGRMDTYTYERGIWSGSAFTQGGGTALRETVTHGTTNSPNGIAGKTTREISIQDEFGNSVRQETYIYDGSYSLIQWSSNTYDDDGHLIDSVRSDGTQASSTWGCCDKESDTDARGIVRTYTYDDLGRMETSTKGGEGTQGPIMTSYTYDAAGRQLTQTVTGGGLSLTSTNVYDDAGRLESTTDATGLVTSYAYTSAGRITTVTRPGGAKEITEQYLDGRTKSVTGTGVVPRYYTYGVDTDGTQWTQVNTGSESSPMWEKTTTDMLGRTIKMERPGYNGTEVTENFYNDKGQLIKTTTTGQADTLYAYDTLGNQIKSGLDVDNSGDLEDGSTDRINETETYFTQIDTSWWQETIQKTYAEASSDAATTIGTQRARVSGLDGGKVSETVSIDIHGNQTVSTATINRAAKTETRTIDYPDSTINAVSTSVNGLLTSSTSKSGVTVTYGYDALGRRTSVTDPRTGAVTTHYNDKGQVDYVEDAATNRTSFTYETDTGRKATETNALTKVTRYAYNTKGQVVRTWGDTAYPVEYTYDPYGRMEEMHTYRSGTGWTGATWPEGQTADTTKWHYQEATGLLLSKEDAQGNLVSYTYAAGGKLETRTWARTDGADAVVTTYAYDSNTGELTGIDYSDSTPDIGFTYDRLGRQKTVADAVGTRTFAYNAGLQLETETLTGLQSNVITRSYEASGVVGRMSGFNIGVDYGVTYGYETNTGRFNSIGWNVNSQSASATYGYVPNSDLLSSITISTGMVTSYAYEPNRNLRTGIQNAYDAGIVSLYEYEYDEIGRRTSVRNNGQAFAADAFNKFDYNDRNELTSSNRYNGTDITDLSLPVEPETRLFDYDPIGNRISSTEGTEASSYTANSLNQYDSITAGGSTVSLTYDADGNLTAKDGVNYTYNAENRLIVAEPSTPVDGDKKVEFVYDYMGRRIQKSVYAYASSTQSWDLSTKSSFLYDGWNLIQEDTTQSSVLSTRYFIWGLDLSQSMQGAGGIGGLVATVDGSLIYHYCYDGNGNVGQVIDSSDGSIEAHYEYDPYGNLITSSGDYADANNYRFSTKYFDSETELYYYGYRYYSSELGRWINRDPITEDGGLNLYVFINNNVLNSSDLLGLLDARCCKEDCCGLKDLTEKLNQKVTDIVRTPGFFTTTSFIYDQLGKNIKHPHSRGLAKIDGWIQDLDKEYRQSNSRRFGIFPFRWSSCVKLKCSGKEKCIGADKISHFFQQGYMLYELYSSSNLSNQPDDYKYKLLYEFSHWTEGLYKKPMNPNDTQKNIHTFLTEEKFRFREYSNNSISSYKNKWGNILGTGSFVSRPAVGDHYANMRGLEFWKDVARLEGTFERSSYKFDFCYYIKNLSFIVEE